MILDHVEEKGANIVSHWIVLELKTCSKPEIPKNNTLFISVQLLDNINKSLKSKL